MRAKVQDLTLIVAPAGYESLSASDLAGVQSLRRLHLSIGAMRWLVREMANGPGLAEADQISELWLPEWMKPETIDAVDALSEALPRQLRRLLLGCPGQKILEHLAKEHALEGRCWGGEWIHCLTSTR